VFLKKDKKTKRQKDAPMRYRWMNDFVGLNGRTSARKPAIRFQRINFSEKFC
jgi:hypothetical protein